MKLSCQVEISYVNVHFFFNFLKEAHKVAASLDIFFFFFSIIGEETGEREAA